MKSTWAFEEIHLSLDRTKIIIFGFTSTYADSDKEFIFEDHLWLKDKENDYENELIYIYDFHDNSWSEFGILPINEAHRFTCETNIAKNKSKYKNIMIFQNVWLNTNVFREIISVSIPKYYGSGNKLKLWRCHLISAECSGYDFVANYFGKVTKIIGQLEII